MSTRSVIGYRINGIKWKGTFHHWDGYPSGVGVTLLELAKERGTDFIRKEIVDKHAGGWSTINANWEVEPRLVEDCPTEERDQKPPEFYETTEKSRFCSEKDLPGSGGVEYLYLITKRNTIQVYLPRYIKGKFKGDRMIGAFGAGAPDVGRGEEVKWEKIGEVKITDSIEAMEALEEK